MRHFLFYNRRTYGPYPYEEIVDWWKVRQIPDDALICDDGTEAWRPIAQSMPSRVLPKSTVIESPKKPADELSVNSHFQWLLPWRLFSSLEWVKETGLIALLIIGLFPIAAATLFPFLNEYWTISVYFSILWALFLFKFFKTPETRFPACVTAFFFTPIFSVATLLEAQRTSPLLLLDAATNSADFWTRFTGFVLGVGFSEELCKAAVVLLIVWRAKTPFHPSTAILYGMMSGLGFGIFEGLFYQQYVNPNAGFEAAYLLNILRLTSLPFLHSMWAGLAAYFIGTSRFVRHGRWLFTIFGIIMAALLHGLYDQFSGSWPSLIVSVCSVIVLLTYLLNCRQLEASQIGSR